MTWLGLTRFTRLTQPSQGQKAKPVYLKELLEFGAWNLFLRLGLTRSARLTQRSQGQKAKPHNLRL